MRRYPHVAAAVFDRPWLIQQSAMRAIVEVLELRLEGGRLSDDEIAERLAVARRDAGPRQGGRRAGAVAVIPVYGVISQRANLMTEMSGGTTVESVTRAFREALGDPEVTGVLFDIDSPGGSAAGVPELAEEIRAARGRKPIVAVSNALMASAAYWIGSQADELVVAPSSLTGSIGVVMAHEDWTGAEEKLGIKTTLVYAGDFKVEGYDTVPLTDDARAYMQTLVDDLYGAFLKAVGAARGVTAAVVRESFGQGRVLTPRQAVKVGMADRVATFDDAVIRLSQGKVTSRVAAAALGEALTTTTPDLNVSVTVTSSATTATIDSHEPDVPDESDEDPAAEVEVAAARARARAR